MPAITSEDLQFGCVGQTEQFSIELLPPFANNGGFTGNGNVTVAVGDLTFTATDALFGSAIYGNGERGASVTLTSPATLGGTEYTVGFGCGANIWALRIVPNGTDWNLFMDDGSPSATPVATLAAGTHTLLLTKLANIVSYYVNGSVVGTGTSNLSPVKSYVATVGAGVISDNAAVQYAASNYHEPAVVWSVTGGGTINASTGDFEVTAPYTAGTYTVSATQNCGDAPLTDTFTLLNALAIAPAIAPGETCLKVQAGTCVAFTVTGGSGQYQYSATGAEFNASTGEWDISQTPGSGEFVVVDTVTGCSQSVALCIEGSTICLQSQLIEEDCAEETCCETTLDCGESIMLVHPSFVVNTGTGDVAPDYLAKVRAEVNDDGALVSSGAGSGASAQSIPNGGKGSFKLIVNPTMINGSATFVGWSDIDLDTNPDTIEHAIGVSATGRIEVRESGTVVYTGANASVGNELSVVFNGSTFSYLVNGNVVYTSTATACGALVLDIALGQNVSIGGAAAATFSIVTSGSPAEVGTINMQGRYTAPHRATSVAVQSQLGATTKHHIIQVAQPTPTESNPRELWRGGFDYIAFNVNPLKPGQTLKLASNGTPSRDVAPNALVLEGGDLVVGGVNFETTAEETEFVLERGTVAVGESDYSGTLTFTVANIGNQKLLKLIDSHAVSGSANGRKELHFVGRPCGAPYMNLVLIRRSDCDATGFDYLYIPRAQVTSTLTFDAKNDEFNGYEVTIRFFKDPSFRVKGKPALFTQSLGAACTLNAQPCN